MFRLTLKNLWAYKKRLVASGLSIVIGISFLSGSFIFTDTLRGLFDDLFSSSVKGVDAQVRQIRAFGSDTDGGPYDDGRAGVPAALMGDISKIDGVAALTGFIQGYAQPISKKGKLVGSGGAPTFGYVWIEDTVLSPYKLFSGRAPRKGEVVFDRALMKKTGYKKGERVKVNTLAGAREFTLVGDATFGSSDSALGASSVFFDPETGQEVLFRKGFVQSVMVRATGGVSEEQLVERIKTGLADKQFEGRTELEVITGKALEKEQLNFVKVVFGFINTFLNAFAAVALFVSIFVISNSFSILVAQRTKEMAGLRILGASRKQILGATFGEALSVGVIASAIGIAFGFVTALGIKTLLSVFGGASGLPSTGYVLKPRTVVVGMLVGTLVTVLSAIAPAIRSGRVKPLAALRETSIDRAGTSKIRLVFGLLFLAAMIALLVVGLGKDGSDGAKIIGGSAAASLFTVSFLGPLLARPVAGLFGRKWFGVVVVLFGVILGVGGAVVAIALGAKQVRDYTGTRTVQSLTSAVIATLVTFGVWSFWKYRKNRGNDRPDSRVDTSVTKMVVGSAAVGLLFFNIPLGLGVLAALAGWYLVVTGNVAGTTSGQIARENAIRNPTRTSATALALTIGTALVSALLVLSSSLTQTFRGAFDDLITADHVVASTAQEVGFPLSVQQEINAVPGVVASSSIQFASFRFGFPARQRSVGGIDATDFEQVVNLGQVEGSVTALTKPDTIAVAKTTAKEQKLSIGDTIKPTFRNGRKTTLTIVALYDNAEGLGNLYYLVDNKATLGKYIETLTANQLYVKTTASDRASREKIVKAADAALAPYPAAEFQTKKKFVDDQVGQFQQFLAVVNLLLALAILIAVLGIANTLRLSVLERTREIGLLRAVGMSRDQLKSSIRWEAIVVATFGAVVGVVLGTGFGSALVQVLGKDSVLSLTIPVPFLVPLALLASVVGLYAARKPAADASRLNILRAIATE